VADAAGAAARGRGVAGALGAALTIGLGTLAVVCFGTGCVAGVLAAWALIATYWLPRD